MAALGRPRATASIGYATPSPTPSPLHLVVHTALASASRRRPSGRPLIVTAQWASPWFPPSSLRCCGTPGVEKANLSNVRYVICGVAPLTRHLLEAVERGCDPQVLEGHGLTDGTCVRA
jgi:acyl-CoA synthetase (AMP-forming)/AMP-acid ligase II